MASREVETRAEPDLPTGDWTVALRLSGALDTPLRREVYTQLQDTFQEDTPLGWGSQLRTKLWNPVDGAIYTRFTGVGLPGMSVLRDSTTAVVLGMIAKGIDAEIQARIAPTYEVNPEPSELPATFFHLDRVTPEALAIQQELLSAQLEFNEQDFKHLQDC